MFRRRAVISLFIVATAAIAAAPARAQRPDPLGPLVAEALRANLGIEQERFQERRAVASLHEARGLMLPTIGVTSRYSHLSGVLNLGDLVNPAYAALNRLIGTNQFPTDIDLTQPRKHETTVRLTQPLFNEEILGNYALARSRRDAQRMHLRSAARRLAADVQTAYLEAASALRVVGIYESALALLQENERVSQRLLTAGRATPEAVYRARAERADVEQNLAEARESQVSAARALNQILRRPLGTPLDAIPDSAFDWPLTISADGAVVHAMSFREELGEAEAGIRSAQSGRRIATATYLPNISMVLDYGFQSQDFAFRRDDDFWATSIVASWRLFDGGQGAARRSASRYDVERGRAFRRDLADRIEVEVRTAHGQAAVARSAIVTADTRLEAARRTFELVRHRYEEGVATPIEFIDARSAYTSAQLNRVLTGYRYAIRWVDLERAAALRPPAL